MEFRGKSVLITGANGLVGHPTVKKCLEEGATKVYAHIFTIVKSCSILET